MGDRPAGVGLHNWRQSPYSRWAFHHVRELMPTVAIPRAHASGGALATELADLGDLSVEGPDGSRGLVDLLETSFTDAFVVSAGDRVVLEWQAPHMDIRQPHILFSVSKSLTGILSGILADRGLFDPELPVAHYLSGAERGAFGNCSMRHVLDMTVAMDFEENYTDPSSVYVEYRNATGWNPVDQRDPGPDLADFLLSIRPDGERHGEAFRYRSPNSDLLGLVLERAAGQRLPRLFSEHLWQPLGASTDAYATVDRSGLARGAGGLCVTIHDLARVGRMILDNGMVNGRQVISGGWIEDTYHNGDPAAWQAGGFVNLFPRGRYRNQWYRVGGDSHALCALGIHGQYLYVDPSSRVVIAKLSSLPEPIDESLDIELLSAFHQIAAML